jgi:hypothetical protein
MPLNPEAIVGVCIRTVLIWDYNSIPLLRTSPASPNWEKWCGKMKMKHVMKMMAEKKKGENSHTDEIGWIVPTNVLNPPFVPIMAGGRNKPTVEAIAARKARLTELEHRAQLEREELEAAKREAEEQAAEEERKQEATAAQDHARQRYVRGCRDCADMEVMAQQSASPVASRSGESVSSSWYVLHAHDRCWASQG